MIALGAKMSNLDSHLSKNLAPVAKQARVLSFDIVRVLALFFVIFFHVDVRTYTIGESFFPVVINLGELGVSIFIILSGLSLSIHSFKNKTLPQFYCRRLGSILPFLWFGYIATSVILFSFGKLQPHAYGFPIIYTIMGLDGYLGTHIPTYYLVGEWFTGFILLMYLVSPFIFNLVQSKHIISLIIFGLISFLSYKYIGNFTEYCPLLSPVVFWNIPSRVFEFAFGMFFYLYIFQSKKRLLFSCLLAIAVLGIALFFNIAISSTTFVNVICSVCVTCILVTLFSFIPSSDALSELFSFFSKYSYLAFIYHHQLVILILEKTGAIYPPSIYRTFFVALATLFISYVLAYLSYKPSIFLRKLVFKF